ncbi:hypothetical protein IE53DRAFT_386707 [Violaceomyces palustris]|uniref:Uncharacterized protein n=1 Tax=Violaceomyces palustris TaxID=1673888 RepID=A0ACD0NYQ9_9BASI|nr:hypothetical protein IE53DRAFT_386707 [Violaceomyces palustris]
MEVDWGGEWQPSSSVGPGVVATVGTLLGIIHLTEICEDSLKDRSDRPSFPPPKKWKGKEWHATLPQPSLYPSTLSKPWIRGSLG